MLPSLSLLPSIIFLSSLQSSLAASSYNDRYRTPLDYRDYGPYGDDITQKSYGSVPADGSHTYQTRVQCEDMCSVPCTTTKVYLGADQLTMYNCAKLKPPKAAPFFSTLKGNSFYLTLFVLGVIVVGIVVLVSMCFCCSYCCRQGSDNSSRGSSKQALAHHEDGEFKEHLYSNGNGISNGHMSDDIGIPRKERELRKMRCVPQVV